MKQYILLLGLVAAVLVAGCASSTTTTTTSYDPIAGDWLAQTTYNGTTMEITLVFDDSGYFNGYFVGALTLSGHWTQINSTAYNVYYSNKTTVFMMNGDKTKIWDAASPDLVFSKL